MSNKDLPPKRMLDFGQFDFGQFDFGQLAEVEIGRSRNWPKSKLIGRSRTDGVCSISSFSLSFFSFALSFYFSLLFSCSNSSLSSFCFCSVTVFVSKKPELNPKPRTLHPIFDGPFRWTPLRRTTLRRTTLRRTTLRRTTLRRTAQKFRSFFPPPATIFFLLSLSWGPFVEFCWCF